MPISFDSLVKDIDAGITTEENLDYLRGNDFDYFCVSRIGLQD